MADHQLVAEPVLPPALRQAFLADAHEVLEQMEQGLLALEGNRGDVEALHLVFRGAHTLKGNSAAVGLRQVARVTHEMESLLDELRAHRIAVSGSVMTLLLRSVDELRRMVPAAMAGAQALQPAQEQLLEQLAAARGGAADDLPVPGSASLGGNGQGGATMRAATSDEERSLRVPLEKLNRLLTLTGEVAIARGRARQELGTLGPAVQEAVSLADGPVDHLHRELQELVLQLRMVPLQPLLQRQVRVVRDLAAQQGKLVELVTEGGDVEVDTAIAEHLRDPLTHMVRNALDHGLEHAAARMAAGKPPTGRVTVRARHDGGSIVMEVSDDGAGLRRDRIVRRAVERGLVTDEARLTTDEVFRLLFQPGFSTAESITELSGRGVGLDVVRRNVEALRGTIDVSSVEGEGTTFVIRLPLTVAIINGFAVGVGDQSYIIPLDAVTECLAVASQALARGDGDPAPTAGNGSPAPEVPATRERRRHAADVYDLRGEPLPYVRLRQLFDLGDDAPARESIVVVQHAGRRAGLVVDTLRGEGQAVVKSLGSLFHRVPGVAGSTILGDGRVALILDVPGVLDRALALRDLHVHSHQRRRDAVPRPELT